MRLLPLSILALATILGAQESKKPVKAKAAPKVPAAAKAVEAKASDAKPVEPLKAPSITTSWTVPGFTNPESAIWDVEGKGWYVTNMATGPMGRDGKGFISRLDKNGLITTLEWVKGFNAPKGMGLVGRNLFVADIDTLVSVDVAKGAVAAKYPVAGAKFLNDVAVSPEGDVYVSDTMGNAIYVLRKGAAAVQTLGKGPQMDGPNGLLVRDGKLFMAGWGRITNAATFETSVKGGLHRIDLKSRAVTTLSKEPIGNLDGLEAFGKDLLATDWNGGKLFMLNDTGAKALVREGFKNPADLGVDPVRHIVAVPETGGGQVTFLVLN
jgi:hypothetical protein